METRDELLAKVVTFIEDSDLDTVCDGVVNMAYNSPDTCYTLLSRDLSEDTPYKNRNFPSSDELLKLLYDHERRVLIRRHEREKRESVLGEKRLYYCVGPDEEEENLRRNFKKRSVEEFINQCIKARNENDSVLLSDVNDRLKSIFEHLSLNTFRHFLSNCSDELIREFMYALLQPEVLEEKAMVNIIVKRIENEGMMQGNTGRFLIYTKKDEEKPLQLKFTHQISAVFFLMYLIDHTNREHDKNSIDLHYNKVPFVELYHKVYYIAHDTAETRFKSLLYRESRGEIRAGRTNEIIYDIKLQMAKAFKAYDESYFPYLMSAGRHLTVKKERIIFDEDAKELLDIHFR